MICFEKEEKLLENWAEFIRVSDPDIISGYNIEIMIHNDYDFRYLSRFKPCHFQTSYNFKEWGYLISSNFKFIIA